MRSSYFILAMMLPLVGELAAADGLISLNDVKQGDWLKYDGPAMEFYLAVDIYHEGKRVRRLRGDAQNGGLFVKEVPPHLSPDGYYVSLNQLESAELETPSGRKMAETAYCSLVDVRSGCIVARETGSFCDGTFTSDGKWKTSLFSELDLVAASPKADAYANKKLRPAGSPETSYENLLACDSPNTDNMEAYQYILDANLFKLNAKKLSVLRARLRVFH